LEAPVARECCSWAQGMNMMIVYLELVVDMGMDKAGLAEGNLKKDQRCGGMRLGGQRCPHRQHGACRAVGEDQEACPW
jgi:hypothetical protein